METAHARRQAQDGSVEAEVRRLADRMAALEALKDDLAVLQSGFSNERGISEDRSPLPQP
jgi:hypothetical protein